MIRKNISNTDKVYSLLNNCILQTVVDVIVGLSPCEKENIFVENILYGKFLAIKQFKANVVFKGEADFQLKGSKTTPHNCNTDVNIELISESTLCGSAGQTIHLSVGNKKYDICVTKDIDNNCFTISLISWSSPPSKKPKFPSGRMFYESGREERYIAKDSKEGNLIGKWKLIL